MNPTPSPSPHRLFFWLPLLLIALLATALATSRLWPQPVRDRLIRVLAAGSAPDQLPASDSGNRADAEGHDHDDHEGHNHDDHDHDDHDHDDHDHEGHVEAQALTISPQARRSIGLTEGTIALTTFQRTISVPGIVVERRGRSKYTIIAPMTGSVTKILVTEGEAVIPEQPLFEIRLTHEELVQSQADLLKTTEEVDVVRREIARLQGIGPEGIVAIKTILERKYELQKLEAVRTAQRQALLLHGLSAAQVDEILTQRTLLGTVTVSAPAAAAPLPAPQQATVLLVQELAVERGQHVTAGETLALLTDHETLLIEGETFEQDIPLITQAAADRRPVVAFLDSQAGPPQSIGGLRITTVANRIDADSRTLHFYVQLPNEIVRDTQGDGATRFVEWRYKPGQRMQLSIPVEEWADRIVLPVAAVAQDGVEHYVFRAAGDHFDRQPVHVEYRDPRWVVIASDGPLSPGDRIAISAAQQLQLALKNKAGGAIDPHAGHSH